MFDAGPRPAFLPAQREHFAIEVRMQPTSQEVASVVGRKALQGVIDQARKECLQPVAAAEQHVGAVFGLVDDPVVADTTQPFLTEQRIDQARPAIQGFHPGQVRQGVGEALGRGRVGEFGEGVVGLDEAD